MTKGKSTWKYNKLLTARRNYYSFGGDLKDAFNFKDSKVAAASPLSGAVSALGSTVGQIGGSAISGGLESGAGKALSGLSSIASAIPGPWGAIASAGLGLTSGLVNRMFGSKLNYENINKVNRGIAAANATQADATSFDDLSSKMGSTARLSNFSNSYIGKDGWFSNKAKKKAEALRKEVKVANARQDLSFVTNAENISKNIMDNLEANYAAFGGPLNFGSGAIGYDLANSYLATRNREAVGQNNNLVSMPNSFEGLDTFAFGGELNTQGADFTNGMVYIDNGGSHESNPHEGVPMGIDQYGNPNLVEEGETIFNDYVFSKRIAVPKAVREKYKLRGIKDMSFAEASKKLAKESEERPNDPISQRGLEAAMADLAMEQEKIKQRRNSREFALGGKLNKFDKGGPFNQYGYIKDYNGGWFGEDGKYTPDYIDTVNSLTTEQLQKQFDDQYAFYSNEANKGSDRWKAIDAFYKANPTYNSKEYKVTEADVSEAKRLGLDYKPGYMHYLLNKAVNDRRAANNDAIANIKAGAIPNKGIDLGTEAGVSPIEVNIDNIDKGGSDPEFRHRWEGLRYAPAIGLGLATLTDALGLTNKPNYENANAIINEGNNVSAPQVKWTPVGNYLAYNPFDREFYINQLNAQSGATRRALLQNAGLNRGAGMAALLAADYNAQGQLGQLAMQAEEYNLAQRQQVEAFNRGTNQMNSEGFLKAAMTNQDATLKARGMGLEAQIKGYQLREAARQAADQARSANLSGFFNSLGNIGRDNVALNGRDFALATGQFGPVKPEYEYILTGRRPKAKGGKLNRRRRK